MQPHTLFTLVFLISSTFSVAQSTFNVSGSVLSVHGERIANAELVLATAREAAVQKITSTGEGTFRFQGVPAGNYLLRVTAPGFADRRLPLEVRNAPVNSVDVRMELAPVRENVTVTADPGRIETAANVSQSVNIITAAQLEQRAKSVTAQAAAEEEGLALQRTSPTIGAIYVRGLTGNKVNVFVDGVRYSNAAQRGGINTFFNLIDVSTLEAVEVLRGPNSAQYGSDALGGSIQFLTRIPGFGSDAPIWGGNFAVNGTVADASFGSDSTVSYSRKNIGVLTTLSGKRVSRLRPGQGIESHSAFTRFFGLPSDLFLDSRMPDTAFTQYGGLFKVQWSPAANTQVTSSYQRGQQDGGRRFDQTLGGDGNLIADLDGLMLDFFYARLDQQRLGFIDRASVTYSFNSQREERVNQGGNGSPTASINHEPERTTVHGVQTNFDKQIGRHDFLLGAEYYHERLSSRAFGFNPVTLAVTARRPRVPHNAYFRSGGAYLQDVVEFAPGRLRVNGSVRYSAASYRARSEDSPLVGGVPLWPDDSLRVNDWTFRTGVVGSPVQNLSLYANLSRGFRAPHMTDLGTLGLTGSGFEVAAADIAGLGGTVGESASANAVSTGRPVEQQRPETSFNYEFGARVHHRLVNTQAAFFVNNINDNITKQALILPPGAVGTSIGSEVITAQNPNGAVFVASTTVPVLVRSNFDDARIWGFEHDLEFKPVNRWTVGTVFTYIHAEDVRTGLAPNIEGGTPAPDGYVRIRYEGGSNWWIEPYIHAAARQDRLSTLDIEDRRTGATRTRTSIRNFFRNGATARGLVSPGTDGAFGNADDLLIETGETLAQIQDRVLGIGVNSSPLFTAVPGYVTFNVRGGLRFRERHSIFADFENIGDRNYRGISWGVDAPGRSLTLRYKVAF